ncbi:MAG TPA: amidohydrolase family protein [Candidatus Acidoferrum sp.]|nr:amidohydrolase family protein [Candidatus Acidoferrum sp.]
MANLLILRARIVLPITAPPVENGAVLIFNGRIAVVGAWNDLPAELKSAAGAQIVDLGDAILLPGLVNAHCHLDYTGMAGLWPPPKKFIDWIPRMLATKAEWSYSDYARSWISGAKMLLHSGTTTVADIEAAPELLPEVWDSTPLRVISFLEMTGVRSKREPAEILHDAIEKLESIPHPRCATALSPHAPYSTSPALLRLCARAARDKKLPIAVHVAESEQEFEMFAHARGEMFDWLKRNGRDNSDCGLGSPLRHLDRAGLVRENLLAIHANYLDDADFALLTGRGVSIVHCPRSHAWFRHREFPLEKLLDTGINVCLGTDSLATVAKNNKQDLELNMFQEMQTLARSRPTLSPATILKMATANGARALGLHGKIGELSENAFADLIAIPYAGNTSNAEAAVVNFSGPLRASMIGGHWFVGGEVTSL